MEEMRKTALAYFANLPESKQQEAREIFGSIDKDGDGKIDLEEITAAVDQEGGMTIKSFFEDLDKDKSGSLDFEEFVTFFYVFESGRLLCCDGCNMFIKEVYFTCVECFDDPTSDSFDLCRSCYHYKNFKHHDHAIFCDNYALLIGRKLEQASSTPTQATQGRQSRRQAFRNWVSRRRHRSQHKPNSPAEKLSIFADTASSVSSFFTLFTGIFGSD